VNATPKPHPLSKPALLASLAPLPLLILPWLNPFTSGPNASVQPFLFTWACASAVLLWWCAVPQSDAQRVRTVVVAWLVAACASAALGVLQYFDASHDWAPWVNQPGLGQAYGNLRQRNQFATLCSIGLCALFWWAQRPAPSMPSRATAWWGGAVLVAAALLGAALAASGSRTGLLQLVGLVLLLAWWARGSGAGAVHVPSTSTMPMPMPMPLRGLRLQRWVAPTALVAYLLAALVLPRLAGVDGWVFDRLNESSAQCQSRLNLWRNVLYLIAQKPLWGWGWGELDYAHFITLYDAPWAGLRFCEILDNAHNLPLHLAVELGLPVALFLCAALVGWLWRQAPWREAVLERQLAWAVLAVVGVHSLLEYPLWYGQFQVAALLAVWLLHSFPGAGAGGAAGGTALTFNGARRSPQHESSSTLNVVRWGWPAALAGVAIALACAGALWSYWQVSQPYLAPEQRAPQFRQQSWTQLHEIWLFSDQVDFAELAVTPVTPQTAPRLFALGEDLLHFSPEPLVVQKLLQSAHVLGKDAEVDFYARRFKAAFPDDYAEWAKER
jgi:O-antigen ligase